jgi:hypothetical protein
VLVMIDKDRFQNGDRALKTNFGLVRNYIYDMKMRICIMYINSN